MILLLTLGLHPRNEGRRSPGPMAAPRPLTMSGLPAAPPPLEFLLRFAPVHHMLTPVSFPQFRSVDPAIPPLLRPHLGRLASGDGAQSMGSTAALPLRVSVFPSVKMDVTLDRHFGRTQGNHLCEAPSTRSGVRQCSTNVVSFLLPRQETSHLL